MQTPENAKSARMPVLFIGHGSPMNAIENSSFTHVLSECGQRLPKPSAIVAISAHWMTADGTGVTANAHPKTIHDFGGFPQALFDMQYPAPGQTALAAQVKEMLSPIAHLTMDWGLDHGTWSVLHHLYPKADIPVIQVSMDQTKDGNYHYSVGQRLASLRDQGVLIIGSGNVVHNLRYVENIPERGTASALWAQQFDDAVKEALANRNDQLLTEYQRMPGAARSVQTPEHYWPLLYILGAGHADGAPKTIYESFQLGTLSMRCVQFG